MCESGWWMWNKFQFITNRPQPSFRQQKDHRHTVNLSWVRDNGSRISSHSSNERRINGIYKPRNRIWRSRGGIGIQWHTFWRHNAILINRSSRAPWAESNFHNHLQAPATLHSHGALAVNLLIHSIETRTFPSKLQFATHTSAAPPIELHRFSSLASRWRELPEIEFKFSAKRRTFTGIELFRTICPCRRQRYFVYLIRINFSQRRSEGIVVTRPSESSLQR